MRKAGWFPLSRGKEIYLAVQRDANSVWSSGCSTSLGERIEMKKVFGLLLMLWMVLAAAVSARCPTFRAFETWDSTTASLLGPFLMHALCISHCFWPDNVRVFASMDQDRKRFAWGVGLAWLPLVLLAGLGLFSALRGVSQEKATGLAAVAGGFAEALATFGLLAFVGCQVAAIVLLGRAVKREQWGRSMVAVIAIVSSAGILALTALATWWLWHIQGMGAVPAG
jgi:hypothetical protein